MTKRKNMKYKILLVDDDKFLIDMYSLKFKEGGFIVETVFSGTEALNRMKEGDDFDIILLDLIMPTMDGFELLENIRNQKLAKNSAVVILSNQGQKSDIIRAEQFNIDGYIIKASTIPSEVLSNVISIANKKFGRK